MSTAPDIIARFGGISALARELEIPPTTVQYWKESGRIPSKHQDSVLSAAQANGVDLTPADFFETGDAA